MYVLQKGIKYIIHTIHFVWNLVTYRDRGLVDSPVVAAQVAMHKAPSYCKPVLHHN